MRLGAELAGERAEVVPIAAADVEYRRARLDAERSVLLKYRTHERRAVPRV